MRENRILALDLKQKRQAAGLTQGQLADLLGFSSANTVYLIESGRRDLSFQVALRCSRIFGSVTVLFNGERFTVTPTGMFPSGDDHGDDALDAGTAKDEAACAAEAAVPQLQGHALAVRSAMRGRPELLAAIIRHVRMVRRAFATYERALARYPFAGAAFAAASALVEEAVADAA